MTKHIPAIQDALYMAGLDGWLFYDFRGSDPLSARILRLDATRHTTRRWYCLIPAQGSPIKILHRIEPHSLDDLPGDTRLYLSWQEQHDKLREALASLTEKEDRPKVSMQYSPMNAIPYISRVDAGTVELVRSFNVEVVTAADLVQRFEAIWDADQYKSHCYAAAALREIVDETFAHIRKGIRNGENLSEYSLQQFILSQIASRGMHTYAPPIVAVNTHAADPHYSPPKEASSEIHRGDLVLIDL